MGKVNADLSMLLDGFITAGNRSQEEPLGEGGQQLHAWAMDEEDDSGRQILEEAIGNLGAVIAGRKTYDESIPWWGADGPTGSARLPLFVVTHQAPTDSPADSVYTFVTEGIESALSKAKAVAGGRDVAVMGGANLIPQYLAGGIVDEIGIHLVPLLFGSGTRLFEHLGDGHNQLEPATAIETPASVYLWFRVH